MGITYCPYCGREAVKESGRCRGCDRSWGGGATSRVGFVSSQQVFSEWKVRPVRPWLRYFARWTDIWVAAFLGFAIADSLGFSFNDRSDELWFQLFTLVLWIPIEAVMICLFGATPGKALFSLKVTNLEMQSPALSKAIFRSIRVWFDGIWAGLPLITIVPLIFSYRRLSKHGETSWDRKCETQVLHKELSTLRVITILILYVGIVLLQMKASGLL